MNVGFVPHLTSMRPVRRRLAIADSNRGLWVRYGLTAANRRGRDH